MHACSRHVDVLSHPPEQESRQPEAPLPPPMAHGSRNLIGVDGAEYAPLELVWQGTAGPGDMLLTRSRGVLVGPVGLCNAGAMLI